MLVATKKAMQWKKNFATRVASTEKVGKKMLAKDNHHHKQFTCYFTCFSESITWTQVLH